MTPTRRAFVSRLGWLASCALFAGAPLAAAPIVVPLEVVLSSPAVAQRGATRILAVADEDAPEILPSPGSPPRAPVQPTGEVVAPTRVVLTLDDVFRLADTRNARIAQARAAVEEAEANACVASHSCTPDFLRHEPQKRATTEAKLWQQRAELARVRSEVLQEAGSAYYDWLTALRGMTVAIELQGQEEKMLPYAQGLAKTDKPAIVLVESIRTRLSGRALAISRLRQQADAAAAKLAYLIGACATDLVAGEAELRPVDLADATQPVEALVAQARSSGPGVPEMMQLERVIEQAIADARCLQRGCNLTGSCKLCGRLHAAQAKLEQARAAREDLQGRHEAGVREARSAILLGREQIVQANDQLRHARSAYNEANRYLPDPITDVKINNVLQATSGMDSAQSSYLQAVNSYNKAQVRLLILLGQGPGGCK